MKKALVTLVIFLFLVATLSVVGATDGSAEELDPACAAWKNLPQHVRQNIPAPPNCEHVDELDPFLAPILQQG